MYGIYANIWGILMVNVTIYIAYMDPMGYSMIVIEASNLGYLHIRVIFYSMFFLLGRLVFSSSSHCCGKLAASLLIH